jgi:D-alanyl-D-alanine carboxypeptidase
MRRRALVGLCFALTGAGCGPATRVAPPSAAHISRLPAAVAARIDAEMQRAAELQQLPGVSVAIGRLDGTILFAGGYGFRNLERREPADDNTVYNIASITKQFTAATILMLAQNHRLTIDDRLSKYLPDVPFAKAVSLRDLMNHTAGLPDYFCLAGYRPAMTDEDIIRLASSQPLHFPPGTAYEYSNTNYIMLGRVIEKVTGVSYDDFVRRHLLVPAHMLSSRVGDVPGNGGDDALGYIDDDNALAPAPDSTANLGYAAGAIDSTVVDLLRWDAALYSGRLLKGAQLRQMLSVRLYEFSTTVRYAFGLHEGRVSGSRVLYHRGRNAGYGGINAVFPDDGIAIAILANNEDIAPMLLVDELHSLAVPQREIERSASVDETRSADPSVDARAGLWLRSLVSGTIDREQLSPAASQRYSAAAVRSLSARLNAFGPLQRVTFREKDSRCLGWDYTYQAVFKNATAEYRFGIDREGKVWNLALDRED